jgi:hypothetical protein
VTLAAGLGTSAAGCSDLVESVAGNDSGAPASGDSGTKVVIEDGSAVIVGEDGAVIVDNDSAPPYDCAAEDASFGAPNDLACTGLYSDFATKTIAATAKPYDPGLHLWSDGATKLRWIALPAGAQIDTTDMNEWTFPVGTKVWKEFSVSGQRIETRMFWKRGTDDWVRGSYAWSADETSATYLPGGQTDVGGGNYEVPSVDECDECHSGRIDRLLGFEAVSLSQTSSTGLNMSALVAASLLTAAPTGSLIVPDDGSGLGAPALGWLHANCGNACHNPSPSAFAASTGLLMRLEVSTDPDAGVQTLGAYVDTDTYRTAVNVTPNLQPYADDGWKRITPHDTFGIGDGGLPGVSLIPYRDETRNNTQLQMPPIDSHIPDLADVAIVKNWITNGNFPQ